MRGRIRAALRGLLFGAFAVCAATTAAAQTPLFSDSTELQITIDAPISALVRAARRSTDPAPATLTLVEGERQQPFQIELSPRGFTRRTGGFCSFPPLRINFDRSALQGTLFEGQNKLKVVTRCQSGSEGLSVLEYTAYRLYNVMTPLSFRVRPARITYRENTGSRREQTQFNFLIEDVGDLAARNHLVEVEVGGAVVQPRQLDSETAALVAMFQFMIGNVDWDMVRGPEGEDCCHNGKLFGSSASSRTSLIAAPYDFDFSGFVNAPYAAPPPQLPISSVRTRYYRGYCRDNVHVPAVAQRFRANRAALNAIVDGETRLSASRRRTAHRYLDDFFEILDDPARVNSQIIERCRPG